MATRLKTIRVPVNFGAVADLTNNTLTTLGTPTIYIPEAGASNNVTFKSVMLFVSTQDVNTSTTTGSTIADFRADVTLNGAAAATWTETDDLTHTSEQTSYLIGPIDFTSHFVSNWGTGTSKTCQVDLLVNRTTGTGYTSRSCYAYFDITYEYEDTKATHIKTVCIPFESGTGALTTTANTTFCTVPQLTGTGGWLCEASPTIRHLWVEVQGNDCNAGSATDHNLSCAFSGGATVTLPTVEAALASDCWHHYQVDASAQTTTATFTFELWGSTATRWSNVCVRVWCTYEFTVSGTTRALNYVELPVQLTNSQYASASTRPDVDLVTYSLMEPGTITTRAQAVVLDSTGDGSLTLSVRVGSQAAYRGYAYTQGVNAGGHGLIHGFASGDSGGSGVTLARGYNDIEVRTYYTTSTCTPRGAIVLLYESDVSGDGIGAHAHTVRSQMTTQDFGYTFTGTASFAIPESNYYIESVGFQDFDHIFFPLAWIQFQRTTGDDPVESGWVAVDRGTGSTYSGGNTGTLPYQYIRASDMFNRTPQSTGLMNIETSHTTYINYSRHLTQWVVTYHSMTFDFTGDITGSGGGTVTVYLYRADTGERLGTTSRTGDGSYTITCYDNVTSLFAEAREGASYLGRSDNGTAS